MNVEECLSSRIERAEDPVATSEVGDGESVAEAVVTAVSSASDVDERELQPLYGTIDPDALDAILGPLRDGRPSQHGARVAFEYEGHEVRIESGGSVRVY